MKYLQAGGFESQPLMRLTLMLTVFLLFGFWVTNWALHINKMGLTARSIEIYYRGSQEEYVAPRSSASMLEVTHGHLAMMALVMLLLTHLSVFVPMSLKSKTALIITAFVSVALGEASGWLTRFIHPDFSWLKLFSFLTLQGAMGILLAKLFLFLWEQPHPKPSSKHHF